MATSESLKGKTVFVTGAGGGLGKAIATAYLNEGANVAICDVHEGRLSEARAEFESTGRFLASKTDITDEAAVSALVGDIVAKFGRLDILVNNAGVADSFDGIADLEKKNWDKILGVNLTGSFLTAKHAVLQMQKQSPSGGLLIQICSVASFSGTASGLAYTVSKHGVAGLVKHTASAYGDDGIYAVGLVMGAMLDTNIMESIQSLGGFNQAGWAKTLGSTLRPEKDAVQLKDVAKYCVFLADRDIANTVNGSLVNLNKNWPRA